MKKLLVLTSILLITALLCGCASGCAHGFLQDPPTTGASTPDKSEADSSAATNSEPARYGSTADYTLVIEAARNPELNELGMYDIVTGPNDALYDTIFSETFGFKEEDYEKYAISIGTIITISYGTIIILPKEGRQQAVVDQMHSFVEQQKKSMENYLQDQYEIANSAVIETAPTGEVLLAMTENADEVMKAMQEALAA